MTDQERATRFGYRHRGDHEPLLVTDEINALAEEFAAVRADERDANARLIAAAPELLECCRWMLDLYDCGSWAQPPGEYLPALRAAVARATGEVPP